MKLIQANIFLYFFLLLLTISGFFFTFVWPETKGFYMFIIFAAGGGLGVCSYIFHTKSNNKHLVCPVGSNCDVVIRSKYSKFLGIPLEYLGMFYYAVIICSYTTIILAPEMLSVFFLSAIGLLTFGAFLFSLYLLFVQAFLLRQWCIWCLLSAMLSTTIFSVSLINVNFAMAFLSDMSVFIKAINALGFIIGIGSVTTAMLLFSNFLDDLNISEHERSTLMKISELTWLGLSLVIISQIISYVSNTDILAISSAFILQTVSLFVVVLSGAIMMIICAPLLSAIPFDIKPENKFTQLIFIRRLFFVTGSVAVSSWYFSFAMNYLTGYQKLFTLILAYLIVIVVSIVASLLWERRIGKSSTIR